MRTTEIINSNYGNDRNARIRRQQTLIATGMNRFLNRGFHGLLLVVLLHGQLVFALPGLPALMDPGCGRHVDASVADQHHSQYQTSSGANTHSDENHCQHKQHRALDGGDTQCGHACQNDGRCGDCNACGHCPTALLTVSQALIRSCGYIPDGFVPLPQDFYPSTIFQPPRHLVKF